MTEKKSGEGDINRDLYLGTEESHLHGLKEGLQEGKII